MTRTRSRTPSPRRASPNAAHQLGAFRSRLDALNAELVTLLTKRTAIALRIAGVKHAAGLPMRAPAREKQVLQQVRRAARGALPPAAAARIFRAIIAETLETETRAVRRRRSSRVARLGS